MCERGIKMDIKMPEGDMGIIVTFTHGGKEYTKMVRVPKENYFDYETLTMYSPDEPDRAIDTVKLLFNAVKYERNRLTGN